MSSSRTETGARILGVEVSEDTLTVQLADGRILSVPLAWYPRLFHASSRQRTNWQILGDGHGIHWPELDEDLSVAGLLRGAPAPPGSGNFRHPKQ